MARIPSEEWQFWADLEGEVSAISGAQQGNNKVWRLRRDAGPLVVLKLEEPWTCTGALGAARFLLQGIAVRAPTRTGTVEVPGPYGRGIDGFRETAGAGRWSRGSSRIRFLRGDGGREQPFLHYTCKNRSSITRSSDSTPSFTSLKVLENSHWRVYILIVFCLEWRTKKIEFW